MNLGDPRRLSSVSPGFLHQTALQIKLIWRLLRDRRVSPLLKLLPVGAVLYVILPDFLPGPIDDAAVLLGGCWLFIELCPANVVAEHWRELNAVVPGIWREAEEPKLEAQGEGGSDTTGSAPKDGN